MLFYGTYDSNGNVESKVQLPEEAEKLIRCHQETPGGRSYVRQALCQLGEFQKLEHDRRTPRGAFRFAVSIDMDVLIPALRRMQWDSIRAKIAQEAATTPGWGQGWEMNEWINGTPWNWDKV